MMEGRVTAALRLLVKDGRTGLLKLDQVIGAAEGSTGKTVKEILEEKHPDANQAYGDAILADRTTNYMMIIFTLSFLRASMQKLFETQHYAHKVLQGHPVQMQFSGDDFALPLA